MSINCPVCRRLHEWGDNFNSSFVRGEKGEREKKQKSESLTFSPQLLVVFVK